MTQQRRLEDRAENAHATGVDALVTGATGFIGTHLVRELVKQRQRVRVFVRAGHDQQMFRDLDVEVVEGNLQDRHDVLRACTGAQTIYNCAGRCADWGSDKEFFDANVLGVRHLLDGLEASAARRLVHLSSCDVYGYLNECCDETQPLRDIGLAYNSSKVAGELEIKRAVNARQLPVTVLRPSTVYGPGAKAWPIAMDPLKSSKRALLLSSGRSSAGLVYIDNLIKAMMIAAHHPAAVGQAYNIRDVGGQSWRDYVRSIGECFTNERWSVINVPARLALATAQALEATYGFLGLQNRPVLTRQAVYTLSCPQCFRIEKICRDLDFKSWTTYEQGMRETRAWILSEQGDGALQRSSGGLAMT